MVAFLLAQRVSSSSSGSNNKRIIDWRAFPAHGTLQITHTTTRTHNTSGGSPRLSLPREGGGMWRAMGCCRLGHGLRPRG